MPSLMDSLRAEIAADPRPELRSPTQGRSLSTAVRKNRVRIGLPEVPTVEEEAEWASQDRRTGR